jgi:hypothetical protein
MKRTQWSIVQASSANAAQTATRAAETGNLHFVHGLDVWVTAAVGSAGEKLVELKSGTTVKWRGFLPASAAVATRLEKTFDPPLQMASGEAVNLEVAALGPSAISQATLRGHTERG